ncbi:ATP-binding protein [Desulfolucanica intricata]|uniref:ATP-binding protein n=1 Tax=Desulfolucanica intricata TaxID=1285191 RepID=UPI0008376F4D|nr:ATP-binding protein [Desulfolucanica intricata]
MRELLVISGKGGTGKTSIVGSFAALANSTVLVDCDVDAANLHLLLNPKIKEKHEFYGLKKAEINEQKCISCGLCEELCHFGAVKNGSINQYLCEGCGFCFHACPENAIMLKDNVSGEWFISDTCYGPMVHAKLGIAEDNSGKLVAEIRKKARNIAQDENINLIITDGPPGIGCPVISALSGIDLALIVTEPTLSGIHDLKRVVELTRHFGVETAVCINKYDLDEDNTNTIENYCQEEDIMIVGKIIFDPAMTRAMMKGRPVIESPELAISKQINIMYNKLYSKLIS